MFTQLMTTIIPPLAPFIGVGLFILLPFAVSRK